MSVLAGEGRVPILFGSWVLPLPPNRPAYLARPDVAGEHPTLVIAHGEEGLTSGTKALARRVARHGYAVIVPDLTRGGVESGDSFEWSVSDLADGVESARMPGTAWASGARVAVLGIGAGGVAASIVAIDDHTLALVLLDAGLDAALLSPFEGALLVLHGTEAMPVDELRHMQADVGHGEWILYHGAGSRFAFDDAPGFDQAAAADADSRIIELLDRCLGAVAVA